MRHVAASFAAVILVPALVLQGCGSSSSTPSPPAADAGAPLPQGVKAITYSMQSHVKAGTEAHTCQFMKAPTTGDTFVVGASHTYTLGSHHLLFFRTDLTAIPAGGDQPQDCYEGPSGNSMQHVRGIIYGAQTPTASMTYPAAVGLPLKSGEIVLMQTHYLDAGDKDLDAKADLTLLVSDGTGITTHAGILFFYDPFIHVPPASTKARAQMRCLVPNDITLLSASSHYHARGTGYGAFLDTSDGSLAPTPFYTSSDWDHPIPLTTNMAITAGSRIRFSCDYTNADATKDYFQGQSAANDEMCIFYGIYYPEMNESADFCMTDPDMFGTGTDTCTKSLACFQACAKAGKPFPTNISIANPDVDPCYQQCLVNGCPDTTRKVFALRGCTDSKCATECADAGSSQCQSCAIANCANETNDCVADPCN